MITKIGDKELNYEKEGMSPKSILFVHGWGGSIKSLKAVYDLLKKEFQCVIVDLPGFGKSSMPDPEWGVEEYGQLLTQFIQKQNLDDLCYVGHSFGGALGVYLAAQKPEILQKLVLIAPSYKRDHKKLEFEKSFPGYKKVKPRITPVRKVFYKVMHPGSDIFKYPELESNFRKIVGQDLTSLVPKINQKTLIIWGDEDKYVPVSDAYYLKEKISDAKLLVYPKFGHDFPKIAPVSVYRDVREFLT